MLKKKNKSDVGVIPTFSKPETPEMIETPTDTLTVKIFSLRLHDDPPIHFAIKVTFYDQLILATVINAIGCKDAEENKVLAKGTMDYDPGDYEKMCMFADCPLVVHVQPLKSIELLKSKQPEDSLSDTRSSSFIKAGVDISCCNVDILSIFLGSEDNPKMLIKKRMEPLKPPTALQCKSWDCLPLLTMEVSASRHKDNAAHHKLLKEANWMKLTLVGSYNMIIPFDNDYMYTAASKTVLNHEHSTALATFSEGYKMPRRFNSTSFYPKWESLRVGEDMFHKGDEKFSCKLEDIKNENNIDLNYYITRRPHNSVIWGSFHRSLLLKKSSEQWLSKHIRKYKWPLEVHIYGESDGYSFMGFMNWFPLLYPGEDTVRLAVPLQWINASSMMQACDCQLLLTPNEKAFTSFGIVQKPSRMATGDTTPSGSTEATWPPVNTGADDNDAFAILEVKLKRPLKKIVIPPLISPKNLDDMLKDMEKTGVDKRSCTGRGQLIKDWKSILQTSATTLRRVPYYGVIDFCAFNRQLSETRTRVELITSSWQGAAVYANNNFVIQQYLYPDVGRDIYDEMLMMVHACLMRITTETLLGKKEDKDASPVYKVLKAARHARQMQDVLHAMELYLQVIVSRPNDGNCWRELSTCLKEIDMNWADVCLNKALVVDPRHPLTLISKGGIMFEKDPVAAEMFLYPVIAYYPFWTTGWIIASAYYFYQGQYLMSDKILKIVNRSRREGITEELGYASAWERELGDWWDSTPILPGMSAFCDAADLLLRLRCVALAEVCLARMLTNNGESAAYFHLVALCCRLRGEYKDALCHLRTAEMKYGPVGYLKSLEAECLHKLNDIPASLECYEKSGQIGTPYSTLLSLPIYTEPNRLRTVLVDLVRRQPSAYAWLALANNWLTRADAEKKKGDVNKPDDHITVTRCTAACVVEALKYDRSAGKAWALLARLTKPSARRHHCLKMASLTLNLNNLRAINWESHSPSADALYANVYDYKRQQLFIQFIMERLQLEQAPLNQKNIVVFITQGPSISALHLPTPRVPEKNCLDRQTTK